MTLRSLVALKILVTTSQTTQCHITVGTWNPK